MYAVVQEGGGQRMVRENDVLLFDLIDEGLAIAGNKITIVKVLIVGSADGKTEAKIGMPYIDGASVIVEVIEGVTKGDKIYIQKFRRRKGYRRRTGHRQRYTKVKVLSIKG